MRMRRIILVLLFMVCSTFSVAFTQDINLLPKYGLFPKSEAQKKADAQFLATIDDHYKGNRKKAADDVSVRGWQLLRQGDISNAMRRFNQAWLIDSSNGTALWGMAVIQAGSGKLENALMLFSEAEALVGDDIDFSADYAKALGIAGVQTRNNALLDDAFTRFERIHERAPQHTLNLQN